MDRRKIIATVLSLLVLSLFYLFLNSCGMGVKGENGARPSVSGATSSANSDGSVTVTITGTGFTAGATVTVDGISCTSVHVLSSTQLTCVLPSSHYLVNIVVTTPGSGSSGTSFPNPMVSTTATAVTQVSTSGAAGWGGPTDALTQNGVYASISLNHFEISKNLTLTGYFSDPSFALPAGSTIKGIKVNCYWYNPSSGLGNATDLAYLHLVKAGSATAGSASTGGATTLPASPALSTDYGSSTDLWGTAWLSSDVNAAGFGVAVGFDGVGSGGGDGAVDYCQLSVYWNP